jgi:putative transposase
MSEFGQNLSPSRWDSKYHGCSCPSDGARYCSAKYVGNGARFFTLWPDRRSVRLLKGLSYRTMCIAIPPKHPVASGIGFLKGKSAIVVARLHGRERNFTGEHLWARG